MIRDVSRSCARSNHGLYYCRFGRTYVYLKMYVLTLSSSDARKENLDHACLSIFYLLISSVRYWGFPGSSASKESACNVGDPGLIPG